MKEKAAVIGAGVIGLTTAIEAQNHGFDVTIYTEQPPLSTTSAKAGAVFEPYKPGATPVETVREFVRTGLRRYGKIIDRTSERESGMRWHTLYMASHDDIDTGRYPFLQDLGEGNWHVVHIDRNRDVPGDYRSAIAMEVPFIDPTYALPWLMDEFIYSDGKIAPFQKINDLDRFIRNTPETVIFNCTGLGARELTNDLDLIPVRGQIAVARGTPSWDWSVLGEDGNYVFPRQNETVLGGTLEEGQWAEVSTPEEINRIIERARLVWPDLEREDIARAYGGLRPYRSTGVRVERNDRASGKTHIISTGFGGAGWTFAFGAAQRAVSFVRPKDYEAAIAA